MQRKKYRFRRPPLAIFIYFVVIIGYIILPFKSFAVSNPARITLNLTEEYPYDIVSGLVANVNFDLSSVVVFSRTDRWYIQPFADDRAYIVIANDGSYQTWIRDWRQIAAFVIRKGFDANSMHEPHKPFPLSVDGTDVLAMAVYPSLQFSGYEWAVKGGDSLGPDSNHFSTNTENVWVDSQGRLHLKITTRDGRWYCAEVYSKTPLGYGTYRFLISSRVDQLDKNVVGSPFLYQDEENELDIEFSRWGVVGGPNTQFVVHPWARPGHREQFNLFLTQNQSSHLIRWQPGITFFQSTLGHDRNPTGEQILHQWRFSGDDVPGEEGNLLIHLNLWLINGMAPSEPGNQNLEMVIDAIEWIPIEKPVLTWLLLLLND